MVNKEEKKCTNPELARDLKEPVCELLDALEKQLLAQKEAGYPVDQALENLKKTRRVLSKILK
jgi:hypothetical protein